MYFATRKLSGPRVALLVTGVRMLCGAARIISSRCSRRRNSTVLGNFNNAAFGNDGITPTFFRSASNVLVRTDAPDGVIRDYEIKYTFGIYSLQQYLIDMKGRRLQALGIAWDSRPTERGGWRRFFLYPRQKITSRDSRHWTGIDQTLNFMCADCHSTNVSKNYDARARAHATRYDEINVACEGWHGPGPYGQGDEEEGLGEV
jgi:hypothetical protein